MILAENLLLLVRLKPKVADVEELTVVCYLGAIIS